MPSKYKKRKDGRYCTHVVIGTKEDGKTLRKTLYATTIRELEERVSEIRRQASMGTIVNDEGITVSEWAEEWFHTYKPGVSYRTQKMYRSVIDAHIIPAMGQMKIKDVRPHNIQHLINTKHSEGLTRAVEKISLTLKQIFKKAVENSLIAKNPAESTELPKILRPKKRALTDEEKEYIQIADLDIKSRAFLYVILYAGLRKGEALALMKKDIDLNRKTISIDKSLLIKGNAPEIKMSPKSEAGNRLIPLPDVLVGILTEYLPTVESLYVFPAASGKLMSDASYRGFWEKIAKRLNKAAGGNENFIVLSKDITAHIFRHTYATMLYYAGVDVKTAQYLLGHSGINVTMGIYTHLDENKTMGAADKINDLLSSSQKVVKSNSI